MDLNAVRRMLLDGRETVLLRRMTRTSYIEVECAARLTKYVPDQRFIDAAGGIVQADRVCVITNHEILEKQWPGPPRRSDIVLLLSEGRASAVVQAVDIGTLQGTIVRFDMALRGV